MTYLFDDDRSGVWRNMFFLIYNSFVFQIGDRGVIAVGENCRFLTDLSLRFCDR